MRASVSVEYGGRTVLFDTSTDLRQQALQFGLRRVDAVFYTHHHADHVNGIDELRAFNFLQQATIPIFANAQTMRRIERYFEHIFSDAVTAGGKANVLPTIVDGRPITVHGMTVQPIPLVHFEAEVTGYRIGPFAYLTDCKAIPETSWPLLAGVTHIILDCLRHETHISHMNVAEALEVVERLRPVRAVFTHMNHEMDYATASRALPPGIELGYDGLVIEC